MTIEFYTGTPGSGKSWHSLETVLEYLDKGKHVIANFPINFTEKMIKQGLADRYMYIPDQFLMGEKGMALLWQVAAEEVHTEDNIFEKKPRFFGRGESKCLVVIDEAGNYFPPDESTTKVQKQWKLFFRQHRKMGYDFVLVSQGTSDINKAIKSCVEYEIAHRKANRVAPFKWLPFTIFFYVRYWTSDRKRQLLGSESSIFVKKFAKLFDTHMMFGQFEEQMQVDFQSVSETFSFTFGNTIPNENGKESELVLVGGVPSGEEPTSADSESEATLLTGGLTK